MLKTISHKVDICVVGGGLAGMAAAISAARSGSSVVLMHERPVLGGNASSEIRMWICGARGENNRETGLLEEIELENFYRNPTQTYAIWDSILYGFAHDEKNLSLLLNCACMEAEIEKGEYYKGREIRIKSVTGYSMTTQQFIKVEARIFIDCSGDSILAPLTGAAFSIGREAAADYGEDTHVEKADNMTMGMSCLLQGREKTHAVHFTPPKWAKPLEKDSFNHRLPNLNNPYENFWYLELGGNRDSIADTDSLRDELVALAMGTWDFLKNKSEGHYANWDLDFMGFLPGKRESRRMTGEYVVTQCDISECRQFEDVIAYGGWPLDDHFPDGFYHKGRPNTDFKTPAPYPLPYRALYSKNVDNLMFAGRNISMTHMAMSSIRVMATCALLGQAAGSAAHICCKDKISPHGVYEKRLDELQQMLLLADCFLPGKRRNINTNCRKAILQPNIEALRDGADREHTLFDNIGKIPLIKNGDTISYNLKNPTFINAVHIVFDSDLNRKTQTNASNGHVHNMPSNRPLNEDFMHMPKSLCKSFILEGADENGSIIELLHQTLNARRALNIPINKTLAALLLTPLENWGKSDNTAIVSFDFL